MRKSSGDAGAAARDRVGRYGLLGSLTSPELLCTRVRHCGTASPQKLSFIPSSCSGRMLRFRAAPRLVEEVLGTLLISPQSPDPQLLHRKPLPRPSQLPGSSRRNTARVQQREQQFSTEACRCQASTRVSPTDLGLQPSLRSWGSVCVWKSMWLLCLCKDSH